MRILTLLLSAFCLLPSASCLGAERPPNILFIAIDDQNDWIGCLGGHPQASTPNIDTLAARGTLFTNAHCQAPLCNASRTSLMTGLRPSTTGIYGLKPWFRDVPGLEDLVTLPQHFARNGYNTYYTGKIYHGGSGRKKGEWTEVGPGASGKPFPKEKLVETPQPHRLVDWGTFPHQDEDKGDWIVASWAAEVLGREHAKPFFLACGFFLPHVPLYVTQKWYDMYPDETLQLPEMLDNDRDDTPRFSWYLHWKLPEPRRKFLIEANQQKNIVRSYLASTAFMDSQIGRVLDALEKSAQADNTIVVIWSDHGWHLGEKGITGKNTLWEESTRVPLVFAGPGISKGAVCRQPAELLDMYPTLLQLAGLPGKEGLEGHNLVPQLVDAETKRKWPAITTHNHDNHTVRTERWRYIRYADGSEELYDHGKDGNEWINLADNPEYAARKKSLARWLPPESAAPAPGSASRILTYENGVITWEGEIVDPKAPIPEL